MIFLFLNHLYFMDIFVKISIDLFMIFFKFPISVFTVILIVVYN